MDLIKITYTKPGATFNSGEEAYADKNSLYPAELAQMVAEVRQILLTEGYLVQDEQHEWDQTTQTLTILRSVSDFNLFNARVIDYNDGHLVTSGQLEEYASQAGWTKTGLTVEQQ